MDVLFQRGEKAGKRHAHGIEPRRELVVAEDALCIRQEPLRDRHETERLGNNFHAGAQLRHARSVANHAGKLTAGSLRLRDRRLRADARSSCDQDQSPQGPELSLCHVSYLPGMVFAAVLVFAGCLTVKSAVREMVWFESPSVALMTSVYLPGVSVASGKRRSMVI